MKMQAETDDMADVITIALMTEGNADMPARSNAITKGESLTLLPPFDRSGSFEALNIWENGLRQC